MPENAAAEGGYGLGANEAFGGQVGAGSVSPSAVGGAQGSFGGGGPGAAGGGLVGIGTLGRSAPSSPDQISAAIASIDAGLVGLGIPGGLMGLLGPNVDAAPSAPSIAPGFNPEDAFGMTAPSINPSTGGLLSGSMAPDTAPSVDTSSFSAPAVSAPSSVTSTAAQELATPVSIAPAVAPAVAPAPAQSKSTGIFGRNPDLPAYNDRGILGKIGMDLAMGLSVNPFAGREAQAQSLADRGYSQADIDGYFGRTDATVAADRAAQENAIGSNIGYVSDLDLIRFGDTLPINDRDEYMNMDRAGQLRRYQQAMGY
jgi:hypothetical protein